MDHGWLVQVHELMLMMMHCMHACIIIVMDIIIVIMGSFSSFIQSINFSVLAPYFRGPAPGRYLVNSGIRPTAY
jgi:hypothetical protein